MINYKSRLLSSKPCHEGTIEVFQDPQTFVPYHGGGTMRDLVICEGHLMIAMTSIDVDIVKLYNFKAPQLLRGNNPVVRISWPDYDVPALDHQFWLDLIEVINRKWAAHEITGVTACCVGGHGRTGTALAILAGLTGACKSDPVLFIRKHYCKKVVESESQVKYIEEMTGIKVEAKPNKTFGYQSSFEWDNKYDKYDKYDEYDEHDYYGRRGLDGDKVNDKKNEEFVEYWAPF